MIAFAPCKINLGLQIISKRPDGFHELNTVFYPIPLHDAIEVLPNIHEEQSIVFTHTGLSIPGDSQNNLCIKAYQVLKKDFPTIPNIKIHLHKNIPMGAGLGGGSSDGSTVLKLLNHLFHLNLSNQSLASYALQLGSDCPFFIEQKACHATGRGEILTPIQLDLSTYQIVLIHPGIHISTAWAFQQIQPKQTALTTDQIVQLPVTQWKDQLINDFEAPVLMAHPALLQLKNQLYQQGATYVSMSGSGSSFFALFPLTINHKDVSLPSHYRIDFI